VRLSYRTASVVVGLQGLEHAILSISFCPFEDRGYWGRSVTSHGALLPRARSGRNRARIITPSQEIIGRGLQHIGNLPQSDKRHTLIRPSFIPTDGSRPYANPSGKFHLGPSQGHPSTPEPFTKYDLLTLLTHATPFTRRHSAVIE